MIKGDIKMKMYKNIIMIIITLIFVNRFVDNAYAEEHINFENITIDDGLSQSTVEAMYQDSRGYIWIGTNDGLNRYNGFEIKVYKADKGIENTIASNHILSISEDKKRNLWVGTDNGISKINLDNYSIVNYSYYNDDKRTPYYNINSILITEDETIVMGTSNGLYYYNEENDSFKRILENKNILKMINLLRVLIKVMIIIV